MNALAGTYLKTVTREEANQIHRLALVIGYGNICVKGAGIVRSLLIMLDRRSMRQGAATSPWVAIEPCECPTYAPEVLL